MSIAVLGAGTWGIALAKLLAENSQDVTVWSAVKAELDVLINTGIHPNLPNVKIPKTIKYTESLEDAISGKDAVLFAVSSAHIRSVAEKSAPFITEEQILIDAAKGLETDTLFSMTEIIEDETVKYGKVKSPRLVALSGPTHAEEVAVNIPTSVVCAAKDESTAKAAAAFFVNSCMRVYLNTDVKGVELCGALKNIIALAAGMVRGMGYGDNTVAMLMTRGIAEMTRVGLAMGCKRRTFMGLAGIGDLIVTCTSRHSRNNRCGFLIGQGMTYKEASKEIGAVVEGYYALEAAVELSKRYNISTPIIDAIYSVVMLEKDARETVFQLMNREIKSELE